MGKIARNFSENYNTGGVDVKSFHAMVEEQSTSGYTERGVFNTGITDVDTKMRAAVDSIVTDVTANNWQEIAGWVEDVTVNPSISHLLEILTPALAANIINNPQADTCIVMKFIDSRIKLHYSWSQRNGQDIHSIVIRGDKVYLIPQNKQGLFYKCLYQHGSHANLSEMYENGTCSNTSYLTATACTNGGGAWTSNSGVTAAERDAMNAAYLNNIQNI